MDSKKKRVFLWVILAAAVSLGAVQGLAQEQLPSAQSLQALTAEWISLQQTVNAEKTSWDEQKAFLVKERELLQKEKSALQKEIQEAEQAENIFLKERAGLLRDKEAFRKMLDALAPELQAAEKYFPQWKDKIPAALSENYTRLLNELKYAPEGAISQRLQAIVALNAELESLQSGFHLTREFLIIEKDREQEFEVLYQGLSRAYAVSMDGKKAAIGVPGETGWTWQAEHKWSDEIRKAIQFLRKEQVAEFITLPVEIDSGYSHEKK